MLHYVCHDLFESPAQTLVNTVNTVGVMGKGIAKEFKRRYPMMFERYREHCQSGAMQVGRLYLYRTPNKWVLNFPTKEHWRRPSKIEWIEAGLANFVAAYEPRGITSASFPQLGCGNGGLEWARVKRLMERYLSPLPIPIFVHTRVIDPKFIPEHIVENRIDSVEPSALSGPLEHVSFLDFLADFLRLFGHSWDASEWKENADAPEPPSLPGIEITGDNGQFYVTGEELQRVWDKLVARGALRAAALPGFRPPDSEVLARHLDRLSYIGQISFVSGPFDKPLVEPGIRYAPPVGQAVPDMLIPRVVENQVL